jgi:BMFP domain-containing protein YqiC
MTHESRSFNLDDLARQLADAIPSNLRGIGQDLQRNFKTLLQSGLGRMDLVTREEFDIQKALLARTREKLEHMDRRLSALESELDTHD